jgi:hypothetical protein
MKDNQASGRCYFTAVVEILHGYFVTSSVVEILHGYFVTSSVALSYLVVSLNLDAENDVLDFPIRIRNFNLIKPAFQKWTSIFAKRICK